MSKRQAKRKGNNNNNNNNKNYNNSNINKKNNNNNKKSDNELITSDDCYHSYESPCCDIVDKIGVGILVDEEKEKDNNNNSTGEGSSFYWRMDPLSLLHRKRKAESKKTSQSKTKNNKKKKNKNNAVLKFSSSCLLARLIQNERKENENENNEELLLEKKDYCIKNRTLDDFVSHLKQQSTSNAIHISTTNISQQLTRIECITCRTSVEREWHSTGLDYFDLGIPQGDASPSSFTLKLNNQQQLQPPSISLHNYYQNHYDNQTDEITRAFDYVALEEGTIMSPQPQQSTNENGQNQQQIILFPQIHQAKTQSLMLPNNHIHTSILFALEHFLDSCANDYWSHLLAPSSFASRLEALTTHMEKYAKPLITDMNNHQAQLQTIQQHMVSLATSGQFSPSNIDNNASKMDYKTSKILQQVDTTCENLLLALLNTLFDVFSWYAEAIPLLSITNNKHNNTTNKDDHDVLDTLWEACADVIRIMLESSITHEANLEPLANAQGIVRQLFCNQHRRVLVYQMLQQRFTAIERFFHQLRSLLLLPPNNNDEPCSLSLWIKNVLASKILFNLAAADGKESFANQHHDNENNNNKSEETNHAATGTLLLDQSCNQLMQHLNQITKNAPFHKIFDLSKKYMNQAQELKIHLFQTQAMILKATSIMEKEQNSKDTTLLRLNSLHEEYVQYAASLHHDDNNNLFNSDEFDIDLYKAKALHVMETRQTLTEMTINLISQWRLIRANQSKNLFLSFPQAKTFKTTIMPWWILRWLQIWNVGSNNNNDDDDDDNNHNQTNDFASDVVKGDWCRQSGARRLRAILAGLLFKALSLKCDEWHAELTQRELLQEEAGESKNSGSMTTTAESSTLKNPPSKSSRKRRKRKKKKAAAAAATKDDDDDDSDKDEEEEEAKNISATTNDKKHDDVIRINSTVAHAQSSLSLDDENWEMVTRKPKSKKQQQLAESGEEKKEDESATIITFSNGKKKNGKTTEKDNDDDTLVKGESTVKQTLEKENGKEEGEDGNTTHDSENRVGSTESAEPEGNPTKLDLIKGTSEKKDIQETCSNDETKPSNQAGEQPIDNHLDEESKQQPGEMINDEQDHENENKTTTRWSKDSNQKANHEQLDSESDQNQNSSLELDANPSVGVIAEDGTFQSAEDFLFERLRTVLDLTLKQVDGPPIIHL